MTLSSKGSDKQRAAPPKEEGKWVGRRDLGLEVGNLGISPAGVGLPGGESWAKAPVGNGKTGEQGKAGISHPGGMGMLGCAPWR